MLQGLCVNHRQACVCVWNGVILHATPHALFAHYCVRPITRAIHDKAAGGAAKSHGPSARHIDSSTCRFRLRLLRHHDSFSPESMRLCYFEVSRTVHFNTRGSGRLPQRKKLRQPGAPGHRKIWVMDLGTSCTMAVHPRDHAVCPSGSLDAVLSETIPKHHLHPEVSHLPTLRGPFNGLWTS